MAEEVKVESQESDIIKEINDSFMKSKRKKNIIIFSIISAIVLVLSVIIISFSAITYNTKPTKLLTEPAIIRIKTNDMTNELSVGSEVENYNKIYDACMKSFQTSYLTAIFTGAVKAYTVKESLTDGRFYSDQTNKTGMYSTLSNRLGKEYVGFHYETAQTLYNANGTVCKSKTNTEIGVMKYVDVYMPISNTNTLKDVTLYIGTYVSGNAYISTITVKANTYSLYKLVNEL